MEPSGTPALQSCTMTPRPASIRMFSSPSLISVVVAMRRGSGRGPPVPSRMTSMAPPPGADLFGRYSRFEAFGEASGGGRGFGPAQQLLAGLPNMMHGMRSVGQFILNAAGS